VLALLVLLVLAVVLGLVVSRKAGGSTPHPAESHPAGRQSGRAAREAQPTPTAPPFAAVAAGTAPGTCLAFSPTRGHRGTTVYVDPGHGGADPGASGLSSAGTLLYEKNLTLATGLDLLVLMRDDGYRVVMSRISDTLLITPRAGDLDQGALTLQGFHRDTEARIACANAAHADVLLAIHFNAFDDPTVNGAETLYDAVRPFSAANLKLATLVQRDVVAALRAHGWEVPDRGAMDDSIAGTPALSTEAAAYGHLLELGPAAQGWLDRPSAMPGVLCEPLFLTHPAEADVAASAAGQQAMAQGFATAITAYSGTRH
jgi:N-acetylmuramoyl-L-alanine amidase